MSPVLQEEKKEAERRSHQRQRRPFAEELWKGLKNHGLKSTSDNPVIEKEEKHFPPGAESKRGEDKEALCDYQQRVTIQTSEGKGSQVAGGHVW